MPQAVLGEEMQDQWGCQVALAESQVPAGMEWIHDCPPLQTHQAEVRVERLGESLDVLLQEARDQVPGGQLRLPTGRQEEVTGCDSEVHKGPGVTHREEGAHHLHGRELL